MTVLVGHAWRSLSLGGIVFYSNKCAELVTESVIMSGTVDDSVDILARCACTTLACGLCASIAGLDSEMGTGLSGDFRGTALQIVVSL